VERARAGEGPSFIEARTYRFRGHHMGDVGYARGYRTQEEVDERWKAEPIGRFRTWLLDAGRCSEVELDAIDARVEADIQAAVEFVHSSPLPGPETITEHVYA